MRKKLNFLFTVTLFSIQLVYGQTKHSPSNLKQAVKILERICPDSLKSIITKTPNEQLISLCYPWATNKTISYRPIYDWLSDEDKDSRLNLYLAKRGVKDNQHQQKAVLIAFKNKLLLTSTKEDFILKPYQTIEFKWKKEDGQRLTTDSLRGIYIPKNLEECFRKLDTFFNDSTKAKIKSLTETEFTARYHLGFGTWLRNNWGLWAGSRLSKYFIDLDILNPEDMTGIIFNSYHRYLLNVPVKLADQISYYRDYWYKAKQKELENKKSEFAEYNIGDTVTYKYPYGYVSKTQEEMFDKELCTAKGILILKNEKDFLLKIRIIETCDKKGLITYDNKNAYRYNPTTKTYRKNKKRKVKRSTMNDELWMNYDTWEVKE